MKHVKTSILLAVILFLAAAQTLHYHARFHSYSDSFNVTSLSGATCATAQHPVNQDECLICQLKGQYSTVRIFHAPSVVFSPEIKLVRHAVFFTEEFYHSAGNSPSGGRAPPAPFLS